MKIKIQDILSIINNSESYYESRIRLDITYGCNLEDVYDQVSKEHDNINDEIKSTPISEIKSFDSYKQELNRMCLYADIDDLLNDHEVVTDFCIEI